MLRTSASMCIGMAVLAVLSLAGCSSKPSARRDKYFASGKDYSARGKYAEAVVQFHNAIEIDPKFAPAHLLLAQTFLSINSRLDALHEFQLALALDPVNPEVKLGLAPLLIEHHDYEQADTLVREVLKADANNSRAHAILGQKDAQTKDLPGAIREMQAAIRIQPSVEYYAALGALNLASGNPSEAEAAYKSAVALDPKSVRAHTNLGQFYFSQGRTEDAAVEMRTGSQLDSHAVPPRVFLARIYARTGKMDDAEKAFKELKNLAPDDPDAYRALGFFYASNGQTEKAADEFHSVLARKPNDGAVKAKLIETLIDLKRLPEAKSLNQAVLTAKSSNVEALLANGRILLLEGHPVEAVAELEKAVNADPKSARNYYFLGMAQREAGLPVSAKGSLAKALELDPGLGNASAALTTLNVRTRDYQRATQIVSEGIHSNPNLPALHVSEAELSLAKGNAKESEAQIQQALEHDPVLLPALASMVKLYGAQGKSGEAAQRLETLIPAHPNEAGLHFLLSVAYFDSKNLDKAEASLKKAMQLNPKTPDGYTMQANIDSARGFFEKAQVDLQNAIQANPRNPANYLALARIDQRMGDWQAAKKICEQAHQLDPAAPEPAAQLALLYLDHGGDPNAALTLAQMVKQKLPDSAVANDILGWAYYKTGSAEMALTHLQESIKKSPDNPAFQYHLGMAYLAAGRLPAAHQTLQRALQNPQGSAYTSEVRSALDKISASGH